MADKNETSVFEGKNFGVVGTVHTVTKFGGYSLSLVISIVIFIFVLTKSGSIFFHNSKYGIFHLIFNISFGFIFIYSWIPYFHRGKNRFQMLMYDIRIAIKPKWKQKFFTSINSKKFQPISMQIQIQNPNRKNSKKKKHD